MSLVAFCKNFWFVPQEFLVCAAQLLSFSYEFLGVVSVSIHSVRAGGYPGRASLALDQLLA